MYKRIFHEEWAVIVPIIAFLITFTFFVAMMVKAARMKKSQRDQLAALPLEDDQASSKSNSPTKP
jgi:phosphate/sulfate permease